MQKTLKRLKKVKCFDFIKSKVKKKGQMLFQNLYGCWKTGFASHTKCTTEATQVFTSFM